MAKNRYWNGTDWEVIGSEAGKIEFVDSDNRFASGNVEGALSELREPLSTIRSGKDANGIFTTVEYKRKNGTLAGKSVLSGGTSPKYTTKTNTYYSTTGVLTKTDTFVLSYDADGNLVSEV